MKNIRFVTIDLDTEEGIAKAEQMHREGWVQGMLGTVRFSTVQYYKPINAKETK